MLVLEGVSVALILALTAIVLFKHGAPVDHAQLSLHGMKPATLGLGVVIAIFEPGRIRERDLEETHSRFALPAGVPAEEALAVS